MGALRAIKTLKIESSDPIAALFKHFGISFNPVESQFEETMTDLKLGIDYAVAISKIEKAKEKNEVDLGVNPDHIKQLIGDGMAVNNEFINDLFEINSEGRDVNSHLEGLCGDSGDGDEMLPHIKKLNRLPKLVAGLKETVESITQHSALAGRVEAEIINDLETCVADLKNIVENQSAAK